MTIYTDLTLKPIYQGQNYISPDGTQYPSNYPINTIPNLVVVQETPKPTDNNLIVTGFIIDKNYTQVWQTKQKTAQEIENENVIALNNLKQQRNSLLSSSDWTMLPDVPLTAEQVEAWKAYRTELRNLLDVYANNPNDAVFPNPPS